MEIFQLIPVNVFIDRKREAIVMIQQLHNNIITTFNYLTISCCNDIYNFNMVFVSTGQFTLRDMYEQFQNIMKMGPFGQIMVWLLLPILTDSTVPLTVQYCLDARCVTVNELKLA